MFSTIHYQGIQGLHDVVDEDKIDIEELKERLEKISVDTQAIKLNVFPNFKIHPLLPPGGISVKYRLSDPYRADMFRVDKYRVMIAVKLEETQYTLTTEKLKEIEKLIRRCLNYDVTVPPNSMDNEFSGWCPSLGDRNTSIGIYQNHEVASTERALKTNYYLVAHTCLPSVYIEEIQNKDERVDQGNRKFEAAYNSNVSMTSKETKLVTFKEHFDKTSYNHRALDIAKENARRLICVASDILDLKLDAEVKEREAEYELLEDSLYKIRYGDPKLLAAALEYYGHGVPIYPFTTLPNEDPKIKHGDLPREELRGYPLGYFVVQELSKPTAEVFRKQYQIQLRLSISYVEPMAMTDYNTFRITDYNYLTWMTGVTETGDNILADEGVAIGFKCHNPKNPEVRFANDWKNIADNMYPVSFPKKTLGSKALTPETLSTIFSMNEGGQNHLNGKIPDALLKEEINTGLINHEVQHQIFNCNAIPLHLAPVKVFTVAAKDDIWTTIE